MSVRRTDSRQLQQPRSKAPVADTERVCPVDPRQAATRPRCEPRVPDPTVSVDSAFSAHTPVSAEEVDAILRLLGDDLDLILGGVESS